MSAELIAIDADLAQLESLMLDLRGAANRLRLQTRAADDLRAAVNKASTLWLMGRVCDGVLDRLTKERDAAETEETAAARSTADALDGLVNTFTPRLMYLQRVRELANSSTEG